jgi:hypothetical protein
MDENGDTNWGLLAIVGAALFAGLVYGVVSAGPPPSVNFVVAEGLLLLSVLVVVIELVARSAKPH